MSDPNEKALFDNTVAGLRGDVSTLGVVLEWDAQVRRSYQVNIEAMVADMRLRVSRGQLTWKAAAKEAQEARNEIMGVLRSRSTSLGRATAEALKSEGRTLNQLIAHYTIKMHGPKALFEGLSDAEKSAVYAEIVAAAARSNPRVNIYMRSASRFGRGLLLLSVAVSVYNVATSDDKVDAIKHEGAATGAGIAGGMAGGALAGLACGPGAPVCVTIGVFVGGAAGALGVDLFW